MFGLGPTELTIIIIIILLIFGAKRLPEIGKGLGGAIREFKQIKKNMSSDDSPEEQSENGNQEKKEGSKNSIEAKITSKVFEQVPGVKKAMEVKKKADKIKEIIK